MKFPSHVHFFQKFTQQGRDDNLRARLIGRPIHGTSSVVKFQILGITKSENVDLVSLGGHLFDVKELAFRL